MLTLMDTRDGLPLHLIHHRQHGAAGTVLLVHDLGEHQGRYLHVVRRLLDAGWAVSSYDQRGHGRSGGARGAIAADDDLLADLGGVIDMVRKTQPAPLVLLGHSLGGLVAARFVAEAVLPAAARRPWSRAVDALVLSSPVLDPGLGALQKMLVSTLPRLLPDMTVGNGLKPEWISRDPAVVRAYTTDPLVHDRINARLARFIALAGRQVIQAAPHWRVPTLLMWSGIDRCVAPQGSAAFAAAAPAPYLRAQPWQALAHEIFNEPERGQVLDALVAWLGTLPR
jgi:alpha-beta hydrolase superfamily lysophospholipase